MLNNTVLSLLAGAAVTIVQMSVCSVQTFCHYGGSVTLLWRMAAGEDKGEPSYSDLSVAEAHTLWDGGIFTLDVRTTAEFNDGHIPGATNIDVAELASRLGEIIHLQEEDILVYCRSGGRSAVASQQLVESGFTGIHNMLGGFNAWVAAGYESAAGAEGEGEGEGGGCAANSSRRPSTRNSAGDALLTFLILGLLVRSRRSELFRAAAACD